MSEWGKNRNCCRVFLLLAIVLLSLTVFISCSRKQADKVKEISEGKVKSGQKIVMTAKVKDFQSRLERLLMPISYHYNPAGKPDPFQSFIKSFSTSSIDGNPRGRKDKKNQPHHCATPLECMDVGQLTLVAVVMRDEEGPLAMVQDAAGLGYVLRVGTKVGYQNGHVVKILPDKVVVSEETEDLMGHNVTRKRVLSLHSEEQ